MKYQSILTTAAVVLAAGLGAGSALAESAPTPPVMTDVAPLPPQERSSIGAVVLEDSLVIAQREHYHRTGAAIGLARVEQIRAQIDTMLAQLPGRLRTTEMGAGPAPATPRAK